MFACYCCCCSCSCLVFPSYRSFVQRRCSVGPLGRTHTHTLTHSLTHSLTHALTHSLTRPRFTIRWTPSFILLSCFPQSQGRGSLFSYCRYLGLFSPSFSFPLVIFFPRLSNCQIILSLSLSLSCLPPSFRTCIPPSRFHQTFEFSSNFRSQLLFPFQQFPLRLSSIFWNFVIVIVIVIVLGCFSVLLPRLLFGCFIWLVGCCVM